MRSGAGPTQQPSGTETAEPREQGANAEEVSAVGAAAGPGAGSGGGASSGAAAAGTGAGAAAGRGSRSPGQGQDGGGPGVPAALMGRRAPQPDRASAKSPEP